MKCKLCGRYVRIEDITNTSSRIDYCECNNYKYYTSDSSDERIADTSNTRESSSIFGDNLTWKGEEFDLTQTPETFRDALLNFKDNFKARGYDRLPGIEIKMTPSQYKLVTALVTDELTPTPMIRPILNISDLILIRNGLEILKPQLIKELQDRADLIIAELARAEQEIKG